MFARTPSKSRVANGRLTIHGLLPIGSRVMWGAQGFITFVIAKTIPAVLKGVGAA
jgi:hypothetical protein